VRPGGCLSLLALVFAAVYFAVDGVKAVFS